jgi:hypothetical protein
VTCWYATVNAQCDLKPPWVFKHFEATFSMLLLLLLRWKSRWQLLQSTTLSATDGLS